jgi:hypothetical protein
MPPRARAKSKAGGAKPSGGGGAGGDGGALQAEAAAASLDAADVRAYWCVLRGTHVLRALVGGVRAAEATSLGASG